MRKSQRRGKNKSILRALLLKIGIFFILIVFITSILNSILVDRYALRVQLEQLRGQMKITAMTSALVVDAEELRKIPLTGEDVDTLAYISVASQLKKIKAANPLIRSVYIMGDSGNGLEIIVDADSELPEELKVRLKNKDTALIRRAYRITSVDKDLRDTKEGKIISAYTAVRDRENKALAILAVDMSVDGFYQSQVLVYKRAMDVLLLGIIIALFLSVVLSKSITKPIDKIMEATNNLVKGNWKYRVRVKVEDEVGKLAESFNEMTDKLYDSRRRMHDYFYNVMQSFVRILEAKDRYTRGHSERVAEYAEKIALRMGFPKEKVELLGEEALLHDIGKLGISESILNKKGKLTEEEWRLIRKHPVIGEEILKPIVLSDEMLAVVREHHERYDGMGYPDHLDGNHVSIFASIISVADAFDAMTSHRAYRRALNKDQVVEELKKNRGLQFNGKVVDVLLEIIEEEGIVTAGD